MQLDCRRSGIHGIVNHPKHQQCTNCLEDTSLWLPEWDTKVMEKYHMVVSFHDQPSLCFCAVTTNTPRVDIPCGVAGCFLQIVSAYVLLHVVDSFCLKLQFYISGNEQGDVDLVK